MPQIHLTKRVIDSIPFKKDGQVLYHDTELRGFGLRVGSSVKTYFVQTLVKNRPVRVTIGRHGPYTPDQARKQAQKHLVDMAEGRNPNKLKKDEAKRVITFAAACEKFFKDNELQLAASTTKAYKAVIDNHLSEFKKKQLIDIDRQLVMQRFNDISKQTSATAATKALRVFSSIYNYARGFDELLPECPTIILKQRKRWHTPQRRKRIISDSQLPLWYKIVSSEKNTVMRDYLLFLLFTGTRKMEAATLKWEHVNLEARTFTLTNTKNKRVHELPFGDEIEKILERRLEARQNEYVFSGSSAAGHLTEPKKAIRRVKKLTNITFGTHDIRRTYITVGESLDLSQYAIKYLLNHSTNTDVTGGYIVLNVERLREPMRKIEQKIVELVNGKEAKSLGQNM